MRISRPRKEQQHYPAPLECQLGQHETKRTQAQHRSSTTVFHFFSLVPHSFLLISILTACTNTLYCSSDWPDCSDPGGWWKCWKFNHPRFIQSVIITDRNGVIIIIRKRFQKKNSNVWMHTGAISLFWHGLCLTINPTQQWSAHPWAQKIQLLR